ncbi:aminodeoxychorismate lyase [Marilutibacter aestuarii]|uniref:Aminodeoxychorismate lyase n=1 Tax=Marilutibacter aestuarii TaxID=1706195 RepID=A0A508A1N2_9GAMM|nr:aminodeoxychorismate lyase [Lysobacter aestuarii]TQD42334.1 aminodeoxychorismate lyase [Lysobacter aestuarii]
MSGAIARRCFIGDAPVDAWPADDRGLAYGDGLFETMRAHRGDLPWWRAHWARLARGAERLRLPLPDPHCVRQAAQDLLGGEGGVLKLLVSRGRGGRGYAPPVPAVPAWQVSVHALPPPAPPAGLVLRWCRTRLAAQPLLAGLKHCNRLEQVLARAEWDEDGIDPILVQEGLMQGIDGEVVCATAANLFVCRDGQWLTPGVERNGVAGTCRAWAIRALDARVARLQVADVETAESVFLCNAVRGILPVARLEARSWAPGTPSQRRVVDLRARLAAEHPAFEMEMS